MTVLTSGEGFHAAKLFHAHLDHCRQCREQPFSLCPRGALLLQAIADALNTPLGDK